MQLTQSTKFNPNYAAQIVTLKTRENHPNADRLIGWMVQGSISYTSLEYNIGDICVYFPVGSQINKEILSFVNLFRDKDLNFNKEKTGFFDPNGRVRSLKIRQSPSEGFLLKIELFEDFLKHKFGKELSYEDGQVFDSVDNFQVCKKYVVKEPKTNSQNNKSKKKQVKTLNLIDDQFKLHYDTEKLAMNEHMLELGDICVISDKWHGTSFVSAKLLTKLPIWKRLIRSIFNLDTRKYDYVYSSRKVIKGVGNKENKVQHYYKMDIWKEVHNEIKGYLSDGMSVYGEIVGYSSKDSMIQKDYDYGCNPGEYKFIVYRITYTNPSGEVFEWDWASIKNWCNKFGISHAPEFYYGPVNFTLAQLKEKYLEKDCQWCINPVPGEGICFRNESKNKKAYKLKSFRFLQIEDDQLDKGEADIETLETVEALQTLEEV